MEFESAGARKQVIISCFYFCSSQIALISRQLADRRQQADDDLSQDLGVDGPSLTSLAPLQVSDPVSQCLSVSVSQSFGGNSPGIRALPGLVWVISALY